MKKVVYATLVAAALLPAAAFAQAKTEDMKGMDMKGMDMSNMKGMDMPKKSTAANVTHTATGEVKKVDTKARVVTVMHEPVKSLNWPAMNMGFVVKDKALLNKLTVGKKVEFDFVQKGGQYVVTSVK